ncbi:acyl-CoA dehydrogenase [Spirosoma endophyticum]|uniref:Butyryl-CoA dehydrogenase n=1 Tax=Spirosoma endophyticum TaxID=662367 RepID=A0A1I1WFD6_9BACT|nr:acyl-CoA dehydrogenase [Spirosoma endophyticum]SFD93857.1 butyryl-CoA dehydrogenase [Spirosoma endophyticum]
MATTYFSKRNLQFLLHEVFKAEELTKYDYFSAHDRDTFNLVLDSATYIADTLMHPYLKEVDKNQPELKNGQVTVHPKIKEYLKAMGDAGLIGAGFSFDHGGQQLPEMISSCVGFILMAANNGMMYTGLTSGAAHLITSFGTPELSEAFVPNMLAGTWQGTMALTEPQAGSSLSDVTTSATPQPDGTYKIKGQKVFISAGDHDAAENIIHLMLARIDGAPKGTKGISLFVVPKYRKDEQGESTAPADRPGNFVDNDVVSTGVYHKMGQKGVPAMHLTMGSNDNTVGYIVGQPHQGLPYMFQMMNEARIGVGMTAAAIATAAYYAALQYAKERPQSRRLNEKNHLYAPQTSIINHPDVRRMLLFQKSVTEGSLSLLIEAARLYDISEVAEGEEKENAFLLLDILMPVAKSYPSEMGVQSVSQSVQTFGGYGYTEDFPVEQLYRDIRITPIYEGTTGIQAQDLLGRKMTMKGGKAPQLLFSEMSKTIAEASTHDDLKPYADKLAAELKRTQDVVMSLMPHAQKGDIERYLSDATLFLELFSIVVIAWQWLKQATVAKQILITQNPQGDDLAFYEGKIHTMKFYFHYEVPKTLGLAVRLKDPEVLTIVSEKELAL